MDKAVITVVGKDTVGILARVCTYLAENGVPGIYGVDIPQNVWHGVECLEPSVLLECKAGPFVEHEVDGILEISPNKVSLE